MMRAQKRHVETKGGVVAFFAVFFQPVLCRCADLLIIPRIADIAGADVGGKTRGIKQIITRAQLAVHPALSVVDVQGVDFYGKSIVILRAAKMLFSDAGHGAARRAHMVVPVWDLSGRGLRVAPTAGLVHI